MVPGKRVVVTTCTLENATTPPMLDLVRLSLSLSLPFLAGRPFREYVGRDSRPTPCPYISAIWIVRLMARAPPR